jgi:hypothetical protein
MSEFVIGDYIYITIPASFKQFMWTIVSCQRVHILPTLLIFMMNTNIQVQIISGCNN